MKLNICCAERFVEGYVNVDIVPQHVPPGFNFQEVDLALSWPWPDNTFTEVLAYDAIEHLPDHIHTMNEAWRVLEPGGVFNIDVPTTDGRAAWQDPTHVSFWNRNSFWYYEAENVHRERFTESYGIKAKFKVVREESRTGREEVFGPNFTKLWILLEAVKEEKA